MSLELVQDGLAYQITQIESFTNKQVSINDWAILGAGVDHAAVLEYKGFESDRETYAPKTYFKWAVRIHLVVRYTDEVQSAANMNKRRDEIVTRILENSTLINAEGTATALDSLAVSGQKANDEQIEIGGVRFLQEWINVEIEELVAA